MTRLSLLITFLGFIFLANAQTKHAILVGIADYPKNEKKHQTWNDLSSDNDLVIIEKMLLEQQFKSENINILKDADATTANLSLAFQTLSNKLKKDDIVFFHFSGHGQQISDVNGKRLKIKNKQMQEQGPSKKARAPRKLNRCQLCAMPAFSNPGRHMSRYHPELEQS